MSNLNIAMLGVPNQIYWVKGHRYVADGNGKITGYSNPDGTSPQSGINPDDYDHLIKAGTSVTSTRSRWTNFGAVRTASATVIVASVALTNGSYTIAAQPDVPRQLQFVVNPGASAITAGSLTLTYLDQNGMPVTDVLSLATGANTAATLATTTGVSRISTATVAGLTGGSSPNIQGGTNTVLALPFDTPGAGVTVTGATSDGAVDTLPSQNATKPWLITPNTAPNNSHVLAFGYNFVS